MLNEIHVVCARTMKYSIHNNTDTVFRVAVGWLP